MPSTDDLLSGQWDGLEAAIRGFEEAWQRGQPPRIDDYLPAAGPQRGQALIELVHADLEIRLKQGEAVRVESYCERYPELAGNPAALLSLAKAEFQLRLRQDPGLDGREYRERFPQFAAELAEQLSLDGPLPIIPGYEVQRLLARGGMGAVYQARQARLDRPVAIKVLLPEAASRPAFAERFQREAQALGRLNHPHIIAVHDFGEMTEGCYLVMELVDGDSLRQRLRAGKLPAAEARRIALAVCEALEFAHEVGIVHRDIKPENILIDRRGWVKVADFGLAKLQDPAGARSPLTASHQLLGTWVYMAPEQLYQPQQADQRADIYSLGVVLYEMLTGEPPLGRFPPLEKPFDDVVGKMLAKDRAERFASVAELKTALAALEDLAPAQPARSGSDGLSTRFALAVGGAFALAWLLTGALANLGLVGLCLAAVGMLLWAGFSARLAIRRVPALAAEWRSPGPALGVLSYWLAALLFLLGWAALIAAHFVVWDRQAMDPEDLGRAFAHVEHRLLQKLPSFNDQTVEAVIVGREAWLPRQGRNVAWLVLSGALLVPVAFLILLETRRLRNRWTSHWQPVLLLSAAMLLALPVAHATAWLAGRLSRAPTAGFSLSSRDVQVRQRHIPVPAPFAETGERLSAWAQQHDYVLEMRAHWSIHRTPDRQLLAQLVWVEGRPRSVFDRWRITPLGVERAAPLLLIRCLGRPDAADSLVEIDPGMVREESSLANDWLPLLDSLEKALLTTR